MASNLILLNIFGQVCCSITPCNSYYAIIIHKVLYNYYVRLDVDDKLNNFSVLPGKNMHWFPVFVSLLASYLSAITLTGVPSEIYTYGLQYVVLLLSYPLLITITCIIYLPIFYRLDVVSSNEYLEVSHSN